MPLEAPNFQYAEDVPHASGDRGTVALVVRRDTDGGLADVHNDYTLLQVDALGYLRVVKPPVPAKFAPVAATLLGVNPVVAAVVGKKLRVLSYVLSAKDEVRATWMGTAVPLTGAMFLKETAQPLAAAGGVESPLLETPAGEPLQLLLSTATLVAGHVAYVEM